MTNIATVAILSLMSKPTSKKAAARMVMSQRITASQSVVLSYRYDHPGATLEEACAAVRVPVACCADIANI